MAVRLFLKNHWKQSVLHPLRVPCVVACRLLTTPGASSEDSLFKPLTAEDISPQTKYAIAGRKYLPGSQGKGFPEFLRKPRKGFPYALEVDSAFHRHSPDEWAKICRPIIDENLPKYGTMLLRGLPLTDNKNISDFSIALGYQAMRYPGGGAADRSLHDPAASVYTASNEPPEFTIELHNEIAYLETYPRKLIFYCALAPEKGCGGMTVIADSKEFMSRLDPKLMQKLEEKHIRYIHKLPDEANSTYQSWQQTMKTNDKKEAEEVLRQGGYGFSWDDEKNSLTFWNTRPAFMPHPDTGEKIWFNSVHISHMTGLLESPMFPGHDKLDTVYVWNATYGDGSEIEPEVIQHIRACLWQSSVGFQWKTSDMLIVDNLAAQHGRLSFSGDRKILAFLLAD